MDYLGIVKRAYEITLKHKFLWIFGILAGGFGSGIRGFNYSGSSNDRFSQIFTNNFSGSFPEFWTVYGTLIVILTFAILVIAIIWIILSIVSQGALVGSVVDIDKGKNANFQTGYHYGFKNFWKVFALGLILGLIILVTLIVLIVPIAILAAAKLWVWAILLGLVLFLGALAVWIYFGVTYPFTFRIALLENRGVFEAFQETWGFTKKNLKDIIIMYILMIAVSMVIGIGLLLAVLIVGGLLFALGAAFFLANQTAGIIFSIPAGLVFLVFFLILSGIISAFGSSVWTLTYIELKKLKSQ